MTRTSPSVTAVVPTHRRPELMRAAVQSVLDQDYGGDVEVLVVFDRSPVDLPDVVTGPGRTVRGVPNDRTPGLAGGRNTGILAAQHPYVAFLDDDDVWEPGKLSAQMAVFDSDPDAVLVSSAMVVDNGRSRRVRRAPSRLVDHAALVADRVAALHSSSFVFRRESLLHDIGLVDEGLPGSYGEDYDLLLRTTRRTPVRVVDEPLVAVRWTGQSFFYGRWRLYADALRYLLRAHPEIADHPAAHARMQSQIAFALAAAGEPSTARSWARSALGHRRTNVRALLAMLISYRLVSARALARAANLAGKGI